MTYDEAIRFWYGRINYETRSAQPEDLKLGRMNSLLLFLGDPQNQIRTVHIAGTKGKGSTAAMINAITRAAGQTVGLFTSPHLVSVEERFQINDEPITQTDFANEMTTLAPVIDVLEEHDDCRFTFFEIATALAWQYFHSRKVDLAVMEVGLGGRFDSTNVCNPAVTVITSIGYDHMSQLGSTLEEIAFQKAGIIKPGVPVISGVTEPGPREVIRRVAKEIGAPLREFSIDFEALAGPLSLRGEHQRVNAAMAVEVAKILWHRSDSEMRDALQNVNWPARIEAIQSRPTVILDCAHNVPSIEALVKTLKSDYPSVGKKTLHLRRVERQAI